MYCAIQKKSYLCIVKQQQTNLQNSNNMAKQFEIREALKNNREMVIAKHNQLTAERFFDGCTLKQFMVEVLNMCVMNNIRSEKTLVKNLPFYMGQIYFNHSKVSGTDTVTANLKKQYQGTAFMAMV